MQQTTAEGQGTAVRRPFLYSVHYFRAFAIINVVLLHMWAGPSAGRFSETASLVGNVRETLFHSATFYFLFISGFLFQYLSTTFEPKRFYQNKVSFVLTPYVVLSAFAWIPVALAMVPEGRGLEALGDLGLSLLKGTAQLQYWYIPFILSLYLFSPLLLRIPPKILTGVAVAAAFLPLLGTRTGTLITVGQYLYFVPAYLGGIVVSLHYDRCLAWMKRWSWALWTVGAATFVWLLFLCGSTPNQTWLYEAVQYLNKAALTFAVLEVLSRHECRWSWVLDKVATFSFALYFVHMAKAEEITRWVIDPILGLLPNNTPSLVVLGASLVLAIVRLAFLLGLCAGLKRILGRFSRYVIGA